MSAKIAVALVVVFAVAMALLTAAATPPSGGPASPPPAPAARAPVADDPPPVAREPAATAALAPAAPRAGRALSLEAAIRELDLIRPSRQKLAEDFALPTQTRGDFRLREQRGKVVLINFWATWCLPCREEMPSLERLYREHRDAGFVLVAVSVDADPKVVGPYLKEHKLTFPVALDPRMAVAETYGVRALPSTFVVDREGRMVALALGPRAWDNLASHSLVEGLLR
jgi:peroxiredoxin